MVALLCQMALTTRARDGALKDESCRRAARHLLTSVLNFAFVGTHHIDLRIDVQAKWFPGAGPLGGLALTLVCVDGVVDSISARSFLSSGRSPTYGYRWLKCFVEADSIGITRLMETAVLMDAKDCMFFRQLVWAVGSALDMAVSARADRRTRSSTDVALEQDSCIDITGISQMNPYRRQQALHKYVLKQREMTAHEDHITTYSIDGT